MRADNNDRQMSYLDITNNAATHDCNYAVELMEGRSYLSRPMPALYGLVDAKDREAGNGVSGWRTVRVRSSEGALLATHGERTER